MKKFLAVLAFAGFSMSGFAQDATPTQQYSVATNSFWSNWFIEAGADWNAWYSGEEHGQNFATSPFKKFRSNAGASVAVGKWFTPGLGLRTKVQGIWGKRVWDPETETKGSFNRYWVVNEQVMFNLSNMLLGYNESRVWDFIPYASVGVNRNMSANCYAPVAGIGILNEFKINNKWAVNLDVNYMLGTSDYDGFEGSLPGAKPYDARSFKGLVANHDRTLNVEVGLTYNLGKATFNKTPDVEAIKALSQGQIDALNAQLADAQSENNRLKDMLAEQKQQQSVAPVSAVTKVVSAPVSVFFNIGKAKVASKKDLQNVKAVAEAAKANNAKIVVTGYADSKTGSAAFNKNLSEKRAQTVADALVNMGVSRDNIEVVSAGGVNTLSPVSYNRRATVEIK